MVKGVKGFPQLSHTRTREKVRGNLSLATPDLPAELLELDQRAPLGGRYDRARGKLRDFGAVAPFEGAEPRALP